MVEKKNLVIVESPRKAETIGRFLGKDYVVRASKGHIRDLSKKKLGIDIEHGFTPEYVIADEEKKKIVSALKSEAEKAGTIYLASDEDREGEAISWHLTETLGLDPARTRRIAFHEITKSAILAAIENPRELDMNLVLAQQARRVLDRLVGFELSPILWKKIKPSLSAGRVQSAALRLIVDREREIMNFHPQEYYKLEGVFHPAGSARTVKVSASVNERIASGEEAYTILENARGAVFHVASVDKKEVTRTPASPFTTSLLQQEAARKCGFSVNQTMSIAQKLYESGLITYMRTDSTNLSSLALNAAKKCIVELYGENYSHVRQYRTKSKGAQEAHEAIRPAYLDRMHIDGTPQEKKLYELIWKRTIASQMADAGLEKTDMSIVSPSVGHVFHAEGSQILFDGFLKVYMESKDDEQDETVSGILPSIDAGMAMEQVQITASRKFTAHPYRYTEASLVKKMEELGIGRPSTYAPTISTLHQRGYIIKADRTGTPMEMVTYKLTAGGGITESRKVGMLGSEKGKLCPENIGIVVTDFLSERFPSILDYGFTANVEEGFDEIAAGKMAWNGLIREFYAPFHEKVVSALGEAVTKSGERVLGTDPVSGKVVLARVGKFGPLVQIGGSDDPQKRYAGMEKGQLIESLTLEEALKLFKFPRTLGTLEAGEVICSKGRFGPYIRYDGKYVSLPKGVDPMSVTLEDARKIISAEAEKAALKNILQFPENDIQVINGRYGPYIKHAGENFRIPKGTDAAALTLDECLKIISDSAGEQKRVSGRKYAGKKSK